MTDLRLHWGKPQCSGFLLLFFRREQIPSMSAAQLADPVDSQVWGLSQTAILISKIIFHQSQSSDVKRYLRMENNSALKPSELISASKQGYAQCKLFHSSTWKVSHTHKSFCAFNSKEGGEERWDTHNISESKTLPSMSLKTHSKK